MIVSRAPVRATLGGGGTDLESYYSKFGGFCITAAVNKYCSIVASKRFYDDIRLSYSKVEIKEMEIERGNLYCSDTIATDIIYKRIMRKGGLKDA